MCWNKKWLYEKIKTVSFYHPFYKLEPKNLLRMLEFVILLCISIVYHFNVKISSYYSYFSEISRMYMSRKKKNTFTVKSLLDNPRRTEISCVSSAQLPFESGIIKVWSC